MNIQSIFNKVKKSYPEINSKLVLFDKPSFMLSNSVNHNIYYNSKQVKQFKFSNKALRGALAHELSHQLDYKNYNFFSRLFFKYKYKNLNFRRKVEREADKITVSRGYGKELIQLLKESKLKYPKQRFEERIKPFHLTISEINSLMN